MNEKRTVIIMKGLPGCGKSSRAADMMNDEPGRFKRVNKDDLRDMIDAGTWSRNNEKMILQVRDAIIIESLDRGFDVIVDDTNLAPKHEARIRQIVGKGTEVVTYDMTDISLGQCLIQNQIRSERIVSEKIIKDMYTRFIKGKELSKEERVTPWQWRHVRKTEFRRNFVPGLPTAIICDIDGTLALLNGRNPYDASRCSEDELNESVNEVLNQFRADGTTVILFTGRVDTYREQTLNFLSANSVGYDLFHMRKEGDTRKDSVIKRELFDKHVEGKYNILFVMDDRNQVVDMWRKDLGLSCFQVNYGNF